MSVAQDVCDLFAFYKGYTEIFPKDVLKGNGTLTDLKDMKDGDHSDSDNKLLDIINAQEQTIKGLKKEITVNV